MISAVLLFPSHDVPVVCLGHTRKVFSNLQAKVQGGGGGNVSHHLLKVPPPKGKTQALLFSNAEGVPYVSMSLCSITKQCGIWEGFPVGYCPHILALPLVLGYPGFAA